jgi:hypothetical protein
MLAEQKTKKYLFAVFSFITFAEACQNSFHFFRIMSQPCAAKDCKRASRTLCHCCDQHLCRDHFNEHDDLLNSQLNPLTDEINALGDRLKAINLDKITNNSRQKLSQWRMDCHKTIDHFYEQKCQELDQFITESINTQRNEIVNLRSKMTQLIDKQETTKNDIKSLTSAIRTLEQKMNEIEQVRVQVDVRPLTIDDRLINIGTLKEHRFDLLSLSSPYRTIDRSPRSETSLASNDRFLLAHIAPNLCLIDGDLSVKKQIYWEYDDIIDMCWSPVLECFLVATKEAILLVDENTMTIKRMQQIKNEIWNSCECSDRSLYLSRYAWDSSVLEFSLLPSIRFVKLWKTTNELKQQQRIDAIVYNRGTLALVINDKSIQAKLVEVRSSDTFSSLWSIQLDVIYNSNFLRCCRLNHGEWLLADWFSSRLFHITNEGKVKRTNTYQYGFSNIRMFSSNQRCPPRLMISRCRAAAVSRKKLPRRCRAAMV